MASIADIMQLCRLCLVKEQVNVPIFEDQDDAGQIFVKITACLPVKISKEDRLPKKICDGCQYKLDLLYQFCNTTTNAEKQLLSWLTAAGPDTNENNTKSTDESNSVSKFKVNLKTEPNNESCDSLSIETKSYILQQQQLPYESDEFPFQEDDFEEQTTTSADAPAIIKDVEQPPSKKRRTAAPTLLQEPPDESDEDIEYATVEEPEKTEEESEDDTLVEPSLIEVLNVQDEQPGPSGIGKTEAQAPVPLPAGIKLTKITMQNENSENMACIKTISSITNINCVRTRSSTIRDDLIEKISKTGVRIAKIPTKTDSKGKQSKKNLQDTSINKKKSFVPIKNTTYICVICGQNFPLFELLNVHMKTPCRVAICSCPFCFKEFKNKSRLNAHISTHKSKPKFPCKKCGKELSNTIALQAHMDTMHTEYFDATTIGFKCKLCSIETPAKPQILNHINTKHLHVSTFLCDICGKSFLQESGLKAHVSIHSKEKPFVCDICSKSFKRQNALRAHMQSHNSEKKFVCDECGKAFKKNGTLIEHKKHHSGDFAFQCNICPKKFVSKTAHNVHIKTHMVETVEFY